MSLSRYWSDDEGWSEVVYQSFPRVRVLHRFGVWHFWCQACMGGDYFSTSSAAHDAGRSHVEARHLSPVGG